MSPASIARFCNSHADTALRDAVAYEVAGICLVCSRRLHLVDLAALIEVQGSLCAREPMRLLGEVKLVSCVR